MSPLTANEGALIFWAIMDPTPGYTGYSPSGFLGRQVEFLGNVLGLPGGTIADLLRTGMKWAAIGLVLLLNPRTGPGVAGVGSWTSAAAPADSAS